MERIVDVGWCPAALVPEREAEFRDIGELCDAMGCAVCTASAYDLGWPPAPPSDGGEVVDSDIPF